MHIMPQRIKRKRQMSLNESLTLTHKFVDSVPDTLEEGVLYVSVKFRTVIHSCCCGCGTQVVTPLSPSDWKLTFDGRSISLHPSVGNWKLPCRSHYWIKGNRVEWATDYYSEKDADKSLETVIIPDKPSLTAESTPHKIPFGFWRSFFQKAQAFLVGLREKFERGVTK